MSDTEAPLPTTGAPEPELVELTHALRRALLARGEFLAPAWVEESARDLRRGDLPGWVYRGEAPALGFLSVRARRAYGHVHATPSPVAVERAERLLVALEGALPPTAGRLDVGLTGLGTADEDALSHRLASRPGWTTLERWAMDRPLDGPPPPPAVPGPGAVRRPVAEVPLEALGQLDWVGYAGTPDEGLVADTPEEDTRILEEIVDGRLGRFLPEASTALVSPHEHLLGVVLVAEQSAARAVVLDLVVHPAHRRHGLGQSLLDHAVRASTALGYHEVRLWVTTANGPARRLYERSGFRRAERAMIYRFDRPSDASPAHSQRER